VPPDRIAAVMDDPHLRQLARDASPDEAPVLIEVAGPVLATTVPTPRPGGPSFGPPEAVTVERTAGSPPSELERELTHILGQTPRYLPAARAFAAKTTGSQLAALAAIPAVIAIRPKRVLRMTR
jgi:hypothetical protein